MNFTDGIIYYLLLVSHGTQCPVSRGRKFCFWAFYPPKPRLQKSSKGFNVPSRPMPSCNVEIKATQLFSCTDGCRATLLRKSGDRCKGKLLTCARCECRYMYHLCTGKLHRLFCLSRNTEHKTSIRVTFPVHELSAGQLCRKSQILGCKWAQRL